MARITRQDDALRAEFQKRIDQKKAAEREAVAANAGGSNSRILLWVKKSIAISNHESKQRQYKNKGDSGENSVASAIKSKLSDEWVLMNDVIIEPEPEKITQIDHIVIGPPGIFIIETKAWDGAFVAFNDAWKRRQGRGWARCDSPTKQNEYHTKLIIKWLTGTGLKDIPEPSSEWIIPIVVFTRASWLQTKDCSMRVFKDVKQLIEYLGRRTIRRITQSQVEKIEALIKYPRLNKALRGNQIKWYGMSDDMESPAPVASESTEPPIPEHHQGTTKDGRQYVRITGTLDEANLVYEHFKKQHPQLSPPQKDRFKKGVYFFYLS